MNLEACDIQLSKSKTGSNGAVFFVSEEYSLKHARFNSFQELKISNSIFGLGKVYLWAKHAFLLILELLEPQPVYFFRTSLCSQKGHPFNRQ
jgi:hypothetical protein